MTLKEVLGMLHPLMKMKKIIMLPLTLKMAMGTLFSQTAHRPMKHWSTQGILEPHGHQTMVAPAPNMNVKCPIYSAKPDEDAKSHLLCSND